jgi:ABC-type methionine transport system permease subunit
MYYDLYIKATIETLYMVIIATGISSVVGIPLGIILVVTDNEHILPNTLINKLLGWAINFFRSIPFIILLVFIIDFTRLLVGSGIGTTASIVPLTVAAIPFVARLIEGSLKEIDKGVIEAARSMGASPFQIIWKVLIPEAIPGIIVGITITFVSLIGYAAMAGAVGGGGLGDLAIRLGYQRNIKEVAWVTVIILVILVQLFQSVGDFLSNKIRKNRGLI